MNMDYSKAFELLNQDAERERNKKAEKAVHDNLYNKGFRDGLAVIDKIRAEIESIEEYATNDGSDFWLRTPDEIKKDVLDIIDKYRAESKDNV